jgi:DNA-binding CsgD family transcriptional regulator
MTESQGDSLSGKPDPHLWSDLTHREQQVTALMVAGMTRKQMARQMGLSADTVRVYVLKVFRKANVHSVPQLIAKLYRLDPPKITARPHGVESKSESPAISRETEKAA